MGGRVIIKKNWNVDKEMENMDKEIKQRLDQQFDFIREIDKEKFIGRQTYLTGAERKENDSEHAWHMAIMTLLLSEYANKEIMLNVSKSTISSNKGSIVTLEKSIFSDSVFTFFQVLQKL